MRSLLLPLGALALAVTALGACGDDDTDAGDTTTTTGIGGTATTADGTTTTEDTTTSSSDEGTTTSGESTTTTDATTSSTDGEPTTTTSTTTSGPIGGPYPVAELAVVVTHPDHDDVAYTISCRGDTASITGDPVAVDEQAACLALTDPAVVERLTTDPGQRICTQQYGGPDEAELTGAIEGVAVDAVIDRRDGCGIDDWDRLLVDVLPPAVGLS